MAPPNSLSLRQHSTTHRVHQAPTGRCTSEKDASMPTNTTPLMDARFACLVMGVRASNHESLEIEPVRHVGGPVPDQGDVRIDHEQPEFFSV